MSVPNLKRIALFVQKLLGGSRNFDIGHVTQATPISASFYFPYAGRRGASSVSVPNLKRIGQFVQKLLGGPEIRSRDPGHAHLRVVLWSCMSVPNLKRAALFVQKLSGGPKFRLAAAKI